MTGERQASAAFSAYSTAAASACRYDSGESLDAVTCLDLARAGLGLEPGRFRMGLGDLEREC